MKSWNHRIVLVSFLVGVNVSLVLAQTRHSVRMSTVTVGQGATVGGNLGSRSGAGNLGSYSAPTGRLRSSIYDAGLQRGGSVSRGVSSFSNQFKAGSSIGGGHTRSVKIGGGASMTGGAMSNILSRPQAAPTLPMAYQPTLYRGSDEWKQQALSENIQSPTLSAAQAHVLALQGDMGPADSQQAGAITTLVPQREGIYRNLMAEAEKAFRERNFSRASDKYGLARQVSSNSPESNLGLMLTNLASRGIGYRLEAYHLQQALEQFPELPSIRFQPRSLYANPTDYTRDLLRLDRHTAENPQDARALLVKAYLLWTDEDVRPAVTALSQAHAHKAGTGLEETILTLWDGMAATGEVGGTIDEPVFPSADGEESPAPRDGVSNPSAETAPAPTE